MISGIISIIITSLINVLAFIIIQSGDIGELVTLTGVPIIIGAILAQSFMFIVDSVEIVSNEAYPIDVHTRVLKSYFRMMQTTIIAFLVFYALSPDMSLTTGYTIWIVKVIIDTLSSSNIDFTQVNIDMIPKSEKIVGLLAIIFIPIVSMLMMSTLVPSLTVSVLWFFIQMRIISFIAAFIVIITSSKTTES